MKKYYVLVIASVVLLSNFYSVPAVNAVRAAPPTDCAAYLIEKDSNPDFEVVEGIPLGNGRNTDELCESQREKLTANGSLNGMPIWSNILLAVAFLVLTGGIVIGIVLIKKNKRNKKASL